MARDMARPAGRSGGPSRAAAILALSAANVMWGSSIVVGKLALETTPPLTLSFLRSVIALAVVLPLLRRAGGRARRGGGVALLGLTGGLLFFVCYTLGLAATSATHATLILDGVEPLAVALFAVLILGERLTGRRLAGFAVAAAGVTSTVIFGRGADAAAGVSVVGDALILAGVLSWSAYVILGRRLFGADADLLAVVAGATLYGTLFLLPAAIVESAVSGIAWPGPTMIFAILYLGVGCTALTSVLYGFGLRHLEVGEVAILGNLAPFAALAAAVVVLDEPLTGPLLAGGALVLAGVWLAAGADGEPTPRTSVSLETAAD